MDKKGWFFVAFTFVSLVVVFSMPPLLDPPDVNLYADQRSFLGIPNFVDASTNIFFVIFGILGLWKCRTMLGKVLFWAIIGFGCASIYDQLDPTTEKLFFVSFFYLALYSCVSRGCFRRENLSQNPASISASIDRVCSCGDWCGICYRRLKALSLDAIFPPSSYSTSLSLLSTKRRSVFLWGCPLLCPSKNL